MYSPKYAVQENPEENKRIIRENAFATVIYSENDVPESNLKRADPHLEFGGPCFSTILSPFGRTLGLCFCTN